DSENSAEISIRGTTCLLALETGHWSGAGAGASNAKWQAPLAEMRWRDLLCWFTQPVRNDQLSRCVRPGMLAVWDLSRSRAGAMKANFQRMAAYNRWANARLYEAVGKLPSEEFAAPRSGFFPSLLKTLNHILVGDTVWMGRLDGAGSSITSLDQILHTDLAALKAARTAMDARIVAFVDAA